MLSASGLTTLGAIPPFLLGAQAVLIMPELGFGPAGLGVAVSVFFAVAATTTILGAGLLERLAGAPGRAVSGALVALGGYAVAGLVHTWPALVAAMAVLGAANAACQGASNTAVASALPPHRRGLGFGIKQSAVPMAIMLGGLAVPTTTQLFGWRSTFIVTGTCGVLVLAQALFALRRRSHGDGGGPDAAAARHTPPVDRAPWRPMLLIGIAIALASMAANFVGSYLASWAHEVGMTVSQAGLLMAAGSASSVLVRIVMGAWADRRHGGNLSVVAVMIAMGAACLVVIGAVPQAWAVVVFGILAFAGGWSWPGLMLYAVARVGRDAPARATSVVQAGAFIGGALGPALLGVVVSQVSFQTAWYAAAGLFVGALVLTLLGRGGLRRDLWERPPREPFGFGGGHREPRYVVGGAAGAAP